MAVCCRRAFPSAPWWERGGYRVALLADAASSEDVEVLAFRKPAETLPATTPQLPAVAAGLPPAAPPPAAAARAASRAAAAAAARQPLPQCRVRPPMSPPGPAGHPRRAGDGND